MPPAILAAAPAVGGFFATSIIGSVTVGSLVTSLALSGASFLLESAFGARTPGFVDEGHKSIAQLSAPYQRMVLGRALVGGSLFFVEAKPPYLTLGVILADHEIDGLDEIRIGDTTVFLDGNGEATSVPFKDGSDVYLQVSIRTGTDDQVIDPILDADFTELAAEYRQRGKATAVVKMHYGFGGDSAARRDDHERIWGTSGLPRPLFLIRGAKCYDPRDPAQSSDDQSTWTWTDTASLCLARYLTSDKPRMFTQRPLAWSEIDIDRLREAATHDEHVITTLTSTERRYTVNGVIETTDEPQQTILRLLTANLGRMIWQNGKYVILSGVARSPTWTLTDNTSRGSVTIEYDRSKREKLNTVRTNFVSPEREYQISDGPVWQSATYLASDGEERSKAIDLPFTNSHTRAQRIAKAVIERSRLGKRIERGESIDAIRLDAADIIRVESDRLPNASGEFEINKIVLTETGNEFEIELEQYGGLSIYEWVPDVDELSFDISPSELQGVN